jgi:integrase
MASLNLEPNGRKTIQFVAADGRRPKIRLGKVPLKDARVHHLRIETLITAKFTGDPLDAATSQWVDSLSDKLYLRIVKAGLLQPREADTIRTLKQVIDEFNEKRKDVKPQTRLVWKQAHSSLMEFFTEGKLFRSITEGDAEDFEQDLIGKEYAKATVRKRIAVSKMLWKWAVKRGYAASNVFEGLKSATVATQHKYFVTRAETQAMLDACPNAQWRLIVALARYGGIRIPSELRPLRWSDIDWVKRRMRITSPKTQQYEGQESRIVPIFPELLPFLEDAREVAPEGVEYVITVREARETTTTYLRKIMLGIVAKAGLKVWPRLFHNMRSSRQTELARGFPGYAVCKWMGNSQEVADEHYLQITDDLMDHAAGVDQAQEEAGEKTVQKAVQYQPESSRAPQEADHESSDSPGEFCTVPCGTPDQVAPPGFEPGTKRL